MNLFKKFIADDSGATAIEYGLIAALVAVVIIAGLSLIGPQLEETFCTIGASLRDGTETVTTTC
ncbi:Flp family type IVb pilin [Pelagibacterium nitratireducens]|jgi:pilus assembly protein Flp/PilA|uniref:Flp family type IVb pilin n=1 Tax=Pelagibacterium nitratireducens TaxID=1046114 RepID=A0ABZ2I2S3_9HYPH